MRTMIAILAVVAISASAMADATNVRPVTIGATNDAQSLQQVLNSLVVSGPGVDAYLDQTDYALFTNGASGGSVATFIIELSGNAASNSFGIYSSGNAANKAQIFSGVAGSGSMALVSFAANGDILVNFQVVASGFGSSFGFYIDNGYTTYYSEDSLNNGAAMALIYQGDGVTVKKAPGYAPGLWSPNEFIIAFEDGMDQFTDFNDLVVMVESIVPVPAPAAALLGMVGLAAVGYIKRRVK